MRGIKVAGAQAKKSISKAYGKDGNKASSYKQSVPLKPSSTKANATPKNTSKSMVAKKVDRMVQSSVQKGAANKVKAQGAKMNMTPSTTAAARARAAKKN